MCHVVSGSVDHKWGTTAVAIERISLGTSIVVSETKNAGSPPQCTDARERPDHCRGSESRRFIDDGASCRQTEATFSKYLGHSFLENVRKNAPAGASHLPSVSKRCTIAENDDHCLYPSEDACFSRVGMQPHGARGDALGKRLPGQVQNSSGTKLSTGNESRFRGSTSSSLGGTYAIGGARTIQTTTRSGSY